MEPTSHCSGNLQATAVTQPTSTTQTTTCLPFWNSPQSQLFRFSMAPTAVSLMQRNAMACQKGSDATTPSSMDQFDTTTLSTMGQPAASISLPPNQVSFYISLRRHLHDSPAVIIFKALKCSFGRHPHGHPPELLHGRRPHGRPQDSLPRLWPHGWPPETLHRLQPNGLPP